MAENKVVFKGWLEKCKNVQNPQKGFQLKLKGSVSWKRAFCILHHCHGNSTLHCFDDEPKEDTIPKGSLSLGPYYCVYKRDGQVKGRTQVFDVTTPAATWRLAAADQTSLDLWVHHLQIQAKLRDDLPGQYFTVRPAVSESAKRIGAQGQQCLLHVSQWGITLAQEWPLKSLRSYGAEDDGRFSFEAGRQAPMGQGVYVFHTHPGQEVSIDAQVDTFVQQQAKMADQECPSVFAYNTPMGQGVYVFHTHPGQETSIDAQVDTLVQQQAKMADQEKAGRSPTKQETAVRRRGSSAQEPDPDMCSEYATLRRMTCHNTAVSPVDGRNQSSHLSFPQDTGAGLLIGSSVSQSQQSSSAQDPASVGRSNVVTIPPPSSSSDCTNSTYLAMKASWSPRSSTTSQSVSSEYEAMSPLSSDHSSPFQSLPSPPGRSGSFQDVSVFPMSPLSNKSNSFDDVSVFSPTLSPSDSSSSYTAGQLASDNTTQTMTTHKRSASMGAGKPGENPFSFPTHPTTLSLSSTNAESRPVLHRSHSEGNIPPPFTNLASNSPPKLPPKGVALMGRAMMSQRSLPPIPASPLDANTMPFHFNERLNSSGSHEYQSLLTPEQTQRLKEAESSYTEVTHRTRSNPEGQEHLHTSPHAEQSVSTVGAEHTLEQVMQTSTKVKSPKSIKGLVFTRKTKTFVKRSKSSEGT
uniref:PH domain-containing protein n=1 Tax=Branchiostoma floridae TaxID=7739 RepID=C3ZTD8_BRAFL|eukprot:XP_002588174.1 hypothetical protein BRAFLDRAFT_68813 [Branchiostoma floridae]